MWKFILGLWAFMMLLGFGIWGTVVTFQNDAEVMARRNALPSMNRAGEVAINGSTVYLWAFDFEGKRCLWASAWIGSSGRGGLTCWEEK